VFSASEGGRFLLRLRSTLLVREFVGSVWAVLLRRLWRQRQQVWVSWRLWVRMYDGYYNTTTTASDRETWCWHGTRFTAGLGFVDNTEYVCTKPFFKTSGIAYVVSVNSSPFRTSETCCSYTVICRCLHGRRQDFCCVETAWGRAKGIEGQQQGMCLWHLVTWGLWGTAEEQGRGHRDRQLPPPTPVC